MPDEPPSPTLDIERTTNIVAAYVRRTQIGADQLPVLISNIHQVLVGLGKPATEADQERTPAVPIRRSVHRDYVVCLECGWRGRLLRRHLATGHGLSVDQYRARWKLPRDHSLTAPGYSERRSGMAKQFGLGRGRRASAKNRNPQHRKAQRRDNRDLDAEEGRDRRRQRPSQTRSFRERTLGAFSNRA